MRQLFNKYIKENLLLKLTSANGVGVLIRMFVGFLSSKAIAIFVGPEGFAIVGYMRNVMNVLQRLPLFGANNGIIRYVAEHKFDPKELRKVVSTMFFLGMGGTLIISLVMFFGASFWNRLIFGERDFTYIFTVVAVVLPFFTLNALMVHFFNGLSRYRKYLLINVVGAVIAALLTIVLSWQMGVDGALLAFVIAPAVILIFTLLLLGEDGHHFKAISRKYFSKEVVSKMGGYSLMAIVSLISVNVVDILIKNLLQDALGLDEVGYWEAMKRLSNYYLMFVTSLLTLYVLPKLAKDQSNTNFRTVVFGFYKTVMPFFAIGLLLVYLTKYYIVVITLSKDFLQVQELFLWQLIGDFIKVAALAMSYQFQAKGMVKMFVVTELLSVLIIYLSSIYLIDRFGLEGVTLAHAVSYLCYFFVMLLIFRKALFFGESPSS
ncbi:O-antigen translocase [Sungkyunkwania multivorans]|uniref:O-antigen translocase n=1 Tax=Sungkyunkwania multivorans TaxID=1173618 RepID=A0ABW3CV25_9FLAO